MFDTTTIFLEYNAQKEYIKQLERQIRYIRDQRGDDRCYKDWYKLYALLPEGFSPPQEDETLELENCKQYIKACHDPNIEYVSPQIRITQLETENYKLRQLLSERNADLEGKK